MATATQQLGVVRPITRRSNAGRPGEYSCPCGQSLRVFGLGRHQVYFEAGSARLQDPVIARACPHCGRGLPGSNPA
jgi:hypothetical protein